jgi:threonine dehydrogenase-like Zn-dependent dehydrogenase
MRIALISPDNNATYNLWRTGALVQTVVFDHDRKIRLAERPEPQASGTGVLLRPSHIGICGTDLHAETLDHFRPGVVMGHEFSARVVAVGSGSVSGVAEGDLVVVNPNGNLCGVCEACLAGRYNLCASAVFEHGIGIHEDGGMAELVAVDERVLFQVPAGVDARQAAWVEPLATAVRAVGCSGCDADSSALVVGAGPIGLLITQVLRQAGVAQIAVVEPSPYRRAFALQVGADLAFAPGADATSSLRRSLADVSFECSGSAPGFESATLGLRSGGTAVIVGLAPHPLEIEPFALVGRELTLRGSIIYSSDDFGRALLLLRDRQVDVDSLTTDVVPLTEHAAAFAALRDSDAAIKILLRP